MPRLDTAGPGMTVSPGVLVAFDTPCPHRRCRLTRLLRRYGVRVQGSVFYLPITSAQAQALWPWLARLCLDTEDRLLMARVSSGGWQHLGDLPELDVPLFLSF